jgi:hypothetical protein
MFSSTYDRLPSGPKSYRHQAGINRNGFVSPADLAAWSGVALATIGARDPARRCAEIP